MPQVYSLTAVPLPLLEHLLHLVHTGTLHAPLKEAALQANGLGDLGPQLAWLGQLDQSATVAVIQTAIAERIAQHTPRLELVWTGPETKVSAARDTAVVFRELFSSAIQSVLIAGFAFSQGANIFKPLHAAMRDRGVQVRFFLHLNDHQGLTSDESAKKGIEEFLSLNWPFGSPFPDLYFDPRTVAPRSSINLHAKCIVIDRRLTLIGSANFTHNAQARNIEVGVLIDNPAFAEDLMRQWQGLVDERLVQRAIPI